MPAGSSTPVHDHLAWGLVGVYRGAQLDTTYARLDDGRDETRATLEISSQQTVSAGDFYTLLPPDGDIHYVKTVSEGPSVSIHLLANDTGCVLRHKDVGPFHSPDYIFWANLRPDGTSKIQEFLDGGKGGNSILP